MKLRDIKIHGFTSLASIELTDLPNLVVLIGKNSAGKSNLIDALNLLFQRFGTSLDEDLGSIDNYHHLFPHHNLQSVDEMTFEVTLTLSAEEWAYLLDTTIYEGRKFTRDSLYIAKALTVVDDSLHWTTTSVEMNSGEIVVDGEPHSDSPSINLQDDEGNLLESGVDGVEFDEFMERLRTLLQDGFRLSAPLTALVNGTTCLTRGHRLSRLMT